MRFGIYLALIGAASAEGKRLLKHINKDQPCRKDTTPKELRPTNVKEPLMHLEVLPTDFTWGNVNGTNYLTNIRNQHLPVYCGSCWAHGPTSALSDRIKIARNATWPDVNIAPQVLISCETEDDGCHGGEPIRANAWMHFNEVTDETCSTYLARGHDNGHKCSPLTICKHCWPHKPCYIPDEYPIYQVDEFAWFTGETNMMNEIYQRGPISCGIGVTQEMEDYTGGVFEDLSGDTEIVHEISIVGFGEDNGTPYWIIRNSWGIEWGEHGFMRLVRGKNNLGIESDCTWATVVDTWTDNVMHQTTQAEKDDPSNDGTNGPYPEASATDNNFLNKDERDVHAAGGCKLTKAPEGSLEEVNVPEKLPWDLMDVSLLPDSWDWRSANGTNNVLSWTKNQHIPIYCGSCWSQGSTSALADRFNIKFGVDSMTTPIALSAQAIINCEAGGSCNGGWHSVVYDFAFTKGIPHSSCLQYTAHNLDKAGGCEPIDICRDCSPPPCPADKTDLECMDGCRPLNYTKFWASSYYGVRGSEQMKTEIYTNGPISCAIQSTPEFHNYTGGVFRQYIPVIETNHIISIVGWEKNATSGEEYWVGRNSWGTYWGEYGYFKLPIGDHRTNLGVQGDCVAAIPSFEPAPTSPGY